MTATDRLLSLICDAYVSACENAFKTALIAVRVPCATADEAAWQ